MKNNVFPRILTIIAFNLLFIQSSFALAPVNDECIGAINVGINADLNCLNTLQGTTVGATQSQVSCKGNADDDVWYKFVAANQNQRITISNQTSDLVLQVFSGTCSSLTAVACVDSDFNGGEQYMWTNLVVGQTYYFRVHTYAASASSTFTVCIGTPPPPPINNECVGAINVPVASDLNCLNTLQGTTVGATQSQVGCGGTADDDVWYKFVAISTSQRINVTDASNNIVVEVFSGTCGSLTSLVCRNEYANSIHYQLNSLTIGQTYYFRVYTNAQSVSTTFSICISTPSVPPANDECAGAITVPVATDLNCLTTLQGTTVGALQSLAGCGGTADDDVWYKFVATNGNHRVSVGNASRDIVVEVFSGACGSLASLVCRNDYSNSIYYQLNGLTVGQTYYLRIYTRENLVSTTFNVCISTPSVPPANDDCAGAISVPISADLNCLTSVNGTTVGALQSLAGCGGTADDDVWYKFVATNGNHRVSVGNASRDIVVEVFSGACGSLASLVCRNDYSNSIYYQLNGLTVGQTYYLRIYTRENLVSTTFNVCISTPSVPPANDDCAGAISVPVSADLNCLTSLLGTTVGALQSLAGCGGTADDDVWYKFVATNVNHRVSVGNASRDIVVEVFSGTCGSLVSLACRNDYSSSINYQLTGLIIGQTYYVRVYTRENLVSTTFNVCIGTSTTDGIPPITNNECVNAVSLPVNPDLNCNTKVLGTTTGATQSQVGCVGTADDDVWYKFVATSVSHRISLSETSEYMVLQAFSGACGSLTSLVCKEGNSIEHQLNDLTVGQTYYIRIYTYYNLDMSLFKLCIGTPSVPPANNECVGALSVAINANLNCSTQLLGTTAGATLSQAACAGTADDDVWYKFVATSVSHRINLSETSEYMVLQAFSGACGSLTSLVCKEGNSIEHQLNGLTIGQTYYLRIYTYYGLDISAFKLCIGTPSVPPANNECAGALSVPINADLNCGTQLLGTTAGATLSQTACTGTADDDVWYKFVATSVSHRINLSETSEYMVVQAFSGACGSLTSLVCKDGNSIEHQLNGLTIGQTYYLRVYTYYNLKLSSFKLCIGTPSVPPANNECVGALSVSVNADLNCGVKILGTTAGATESQVGCTGTADDDVWYKFVATSVSHRINLSETSEYMVLQAFSGACGSLTSLVCKDGNSIEHQLNGLTIGQTYYLRVYTYYGLDISSFKLCIGTPSVPPANDECAGAVSLPISPNLTCENLVQGHTAGALQSQAACQGTADDDVWYKFVATSVSHRVNISDANQYMVLQVFSGTCSSLTALMCKEGNSIEHQLNGLTVGQTYYFRVYSYYNLVAATFKVCVGTPPVPPVNDNCVAAVSVPVNSNLTCTTSVQGTTAGALESQVGCQGTADDDVWYKFVATSASHRINVSEANARIVLQVFSGTCGSLTSLLCYDNYSNTIETQLNGLTLGQTYYFRVYTEGSLLATNFKVCITTPPPPPANDNCAGAVNLPINNTLNCVTKVQGTTTGALQSQIGCNGNADDDVWYKFVATKTSHRITVSEATAHIIVEAFSGACGSLTSLGCRNEYSSNIAYQLNSLVIGQTYYLRVYTNGALIATNFKLCVSTPIDPPANDNCAGAINVPINPNLAYSTTVIGTTEGALQSQVGCNGNADDDVWFKFVATRGSHRINVSDATTYIIAEAFSGTCGSLTSLGCRNEYSSNISYQLNGLTIGQTYYFRVYTNGALIETAFKVCVTTPLVPPANDNCAGAITAPVNSSTANCQTTIQGTTSGALQSQTACAGTADDDVWYKFVATNTRHRVKVSNASRNIVLQVFSGTCASLVSLMCTNEYDNDIDQLLSGLTVGQTYYFRVYTREDLYETDFTVCINTPLPPPINDECVGALAVTVSNSNVCTTLLDGTTKNAFRSNNANCGNGADVWYKFVATNATHRINALSSGATPISDIGFELYSGTCSALVSTNCVNDFWGTTTETRIFKALTIGSTYYVRVFGAYSDTTTQGTLSICVNTPSVPNNDECTNAVRVPVSTGGTCNTTVIGTTKDATSSNTSSCSGYPDDDVWFNFTAISSAHTVVIAPNGMLSSQLKNPVFELFEGTCNGLVRLKCVNEQWGQTEERYIVSNLTVGNTYFIRVYSNEFGVNPTGNFSVCVYTALDLVQDLAIEEIETPISGCNLSNQTVKIKIKNRGNSDQTNVQLAFKVDNATAVTENTGSLIIPALGSATYTFSTFANFSGLGAHTIKVYPTTLIDINRLNDTLVKSIKNLSALTPPTNLVPLTGSTNLDLPVNFSWSAVADASAYDVYVWKSSETTPTTAWRTVNGANSIAAGSYSVPFGNNFKWKVAAKASGCVDNFSAEQTFSTKTLPDLITENVTAPSQTFTEQEIEIAYTVKNIGTGETGRYGWNDVVYLASEPTLNAGTLLRLASTQNLNALSPNQNYRRTNLKVRIPANVLGTYYLIVGANKPWGSMEESETDNNYAVPFAINVQFPPSPDLIVPSVLASPSNTFSQEQISVAYTVQNVGTAPASAGHIDKVYLSSDAVLSPQTDFLLGSFNRSYSIPVATIKQETETVTLPIGISGNYYVLVQTDATNVLNEALNEGNNTGVSNTINVILSPPIDIVVANAALPNPVNANQNVQLNWQVANVGGSPTLNKWLTRIYFSESENIANAVLLEEIPYNTPIEAGQFANFTANVTIPNLNKEGNYFFIIQLDATNTQFEYIYENNNAYSKSTVLKVPDLNPTTISFTGALSSGITKASTLTVGNIGQGTVFNNTLSYHLYLDQNAVLNPSTALLVGTGTRSVSLMLPNDVLTIPADIVVPDGISGVYNLFLVVDQANLIPETNEKNNIFSQSVTVNLSNYPNLNVAAFAPPNTATAGDTIALTYQIRNTGTGGISAGNWQDRIYLSTSAGFNAATALLLKTVTQTSTTLVAGNNTPQSTTVILPENLSGGTYYWVVVTDVNNTVYEYTNENDNTTVSNALTIAAYPETDLQVTAASVNKMTLESGQNLTLNWTVKNNSAKATPTGRIIDAFFLSLDTIVNPGDIKLGSFTHDNRLLGGVAYSHSKVLTIPNGVIGTYYVLVQSDFSQIVKDVYRINNVKAAANLNGTTPPTIQITLSSLVDLTLTNTTIPIEGVAGQPVTITYRGKNNGSNATTAPKWIDVAYLTSNVNDRYPDEIGTVQVSKTLAPTAFYDTTMTAFLPLDASGNYYLTLKTDASDLQYEHLAENNNQIVQSILVTPAVPCDLMPKNIILPASGIIGNEVTVTWQLHNKGVNPARGYVKEGVYWSKDTIWDSDDILAGSLESYINLLPTAFEDQSLAVNLQGIVPSNWYALVKTDIRNNFLESNESNNAFVSGTTINADVPALVIDVAYPINALPSQQSFVKLDIPANLVGETILVTVTGNVANTNGNELYTRFNAMPSRAESEISGIIPFSASQKLYIPAAQLGTYYFLVNDNRTTGTAQTTTILAKQLPFKIETVESARGGNTAPVTLKIVGSKFDQSTSFALESATLGNRTAQNVYFVNPNLVYATFNLLGATVGKYDVVALKTGGLRAVLPLGFEVIKGTPPSGGTGASQSLVCTISYSDGKDNLAVAAQGPPSSRPLKPVLVTISYENISNIDIPIPTRLLIAKEGNGSLSFNPSDFTKELKQIFLELKEQNGPPNILRPGAGGVIQLYAFPERGITLLELFLTE